jgi:hypothetical protein
MLTMPSSGKIPDRTVGEIVAGRSCAAPVEPDAMIAFLMRRFRRRALYRAWARGELELAGGLRRTVKH